MKFVIEQIPSTDKFYHFNVRVTQHEANGSISNIWEQHRNADDFQEAAAATFAFVTGFEMVEMEDDGYPTGDF